MAQKTMVQDDLVFDLGMHKGEDTAFYLAKGYRVIGVEADPDLAAHCRTRFARAIADGRVTILEGAIGPSSPSGRLTFYKNPKRTVWGTIDAGWMERNRKFRNDVVPIEVPRLDIEHVFRTYGMPYYLKIDIEGADHLVLEVLKASGERPPYLSMESEKVSFARLEAELQALQALGYRKFAAVQQEGIGKSFVRVTSRSGESLRFAFEDGASGVFGEDLRGWMDPADCLRRYKAIFRLYRWFGDRPLIGKIPGGRRIASLLRRRILRRPLPGWYDTHAALE